MNTTNTIVLAVVIILLLCISIFIIELFIPINRKFEMNSICRKYVFIVEDRGDLNAEENSELINRLENINLEAITISIDSTGSKFGDEVNFSVSAQSKHNSLTQLFSRNVERILIRYERKLTIRKIIN